jgi:hypothetical protein
LTKDKTAELGALRIASNNRSFRVRDLPAIIDKFPLKTASLGESIAYYRKLRDLVPPGVRRSYLNTVRDILARPQRRDNITSADLWEKCFMREASSRHAYSRGAYYIGGTPEEVDPPRFTFTMALPDAAGPHVVDLDFSHYRDLPHRTILFIGRNGTGKTRALATLAISLWSGH